MKEKLYYLNQDSSKVEIGTTCGFAQYYTEKADSQGNHCRNCSFSKSVDQIKKTTIRNDMSVWELHKDLFDCTGCSTKCN